MKNTKAIFYFLIIILLVIALVYVSTNFLDYYNHRKMIRDINISTLDATLAECYNLNLRDTAECLNKNVKSFYKYNESNIGKKLTFDELREEGGVCVHYSDLYTEAAKALGFKTKSVIVDMRNKPTDHIFMVMSDETGYCIMEQEHSICVDIE